MLYEVITWNVEKGSRGSLINYVKLYDERIKRDEKGKPILDGKDNPLKMRVKLDRPIITSAIVFNAEQIRGIPPRQIEEESQQWGDLKTVEKLVKNSEVRLRHGGNHAYYNPSTDAITMPPKKQFGEARNNFV